MPKTRHNPVSYSGSQKTRRVTSRLAKHQQRKMTQQTLFIIVLALIVLVMFVFAVVPGLIRLTGLFFDSSSVSFESSDTIPPRAPTISAPVSATHSASLVVEGFSEPESDVVLVLNGDESDRQTAEEDGKFSFDIGLSEEENKLVFYAVDAAGNESPVSKTFTIVRDTTPPDIIVDSPQDGQRIELRKNQAITVSGSTEPRAKVYLNDRLLFAKSDGSFSSTYQLNEGDNELRFKAVDDAGNEAETVMSVHFRF